MAGDLAAHSAQQRSLIQPDGELSLRDRGMCIVFKLLFTEKFLIKLCARFIRRNANMLKD